jgi:hypothetical protein
MGGSAHVRRTLAGVLLAGAIGTPATPVAAAVPGAPAKVRAAITEQRRALRALPSSGRSGAGYRQSLAHVRAALNDLVAAERKLATSARETGPLPHGTRIQSLLDIAFARDNHAATQLSEALWLIDRGAPPTNTSVAEIRADLRRTLTACTALAKLVR